MIRCSELSILFLKIGFQHSMKSKVWWQKCSYRHWIEYMYSYVFKFILLDGPIWTADDAIWMESSTALCVYIVWVVWGDDVKSKVKHIYVIMNAVMIDVAVYLSPAWRLMGVEKKFLNGWFSYVTLTFDVMYVRCVFLCFGASRCTWCHRWRRWRQLCMVVRWRVFVANWSVQICGWNMIKCFDRLALCKGGIVLGRNKLKRRDHGWNQ